MGKFVQAKVHAKYHAKFHGDGKARGGTVAARHNGMHGKVQSQPVSTKMANVILHENYCDGPSRASAKLRRCLPAGCALETAASVRAALTDAGFLAFLGSRLAKPSAGFTR